MNINGGKRGSRFGVGVAVVASLLGAAGCGPADFESESIGQTQEAVNISNWDGLVAMGTSGSYTLTASINASGKTWTPKSFSGTFDGGGKTISNLTINADGDAGFFTSLSNATVKNVKFTNLRVTGTWIVGGLAGIASDSTLERIVVEGTITSNGWAVGGIAGYMLGGTMTRSYAKGTANGSPYYAAGGLVGGLFVGNTRGEIFESYAQVTVAPSTSDVTRKVHSGGIVGHTFAGHIHDVYAVGNVTGRGGVGGLVGYLDGDDSNPWMLYKAVSRGGDVVDKDKTQGWEGTVGGVAANYSARFTMLHFDAQADGSSGANTSYSTPAQEGNTTDELKLPTTPTGGVFCEEDIIPGRCGDFAFSDPPWNAGSSTQHHTLRNMPGPNVQPL